MAVLQKKGLDIRLDLVGGGDPEPLSTLASELGISKIVNFRGYLTGESLLSAYREADIFILPSLAEGFPRVIYEAMSQGLPVIATNLPSISSVIENGVSGLLVPPRNPDLLARAIERLVIDAGLRRQLIVNGQELIRSVLSHDASRQFVDLVRLII
jgi:glycosyltransferase involved in cell wall biosynthesis